MLGIFSNIKEKVTKHVEVRVKLFQLTVISRTSSLLSFFMFALIVLFMAFCMMLFIGFGITQALVNAGISTVWSYFVTTGIYCILLFILLANRKGVLRFFTSTFVSVLTDESDDDDDADAEKKTP